MLTNLQTAILKRISPGVPSCCGGGVYKGKSKLKVLMGETFLPVSLARTSLILVVEREQMPLKWPQTVRGA